MDTSVAGHGTLPSPTSGRRVSGSRVTDPKTGFRRHFQDSVEVLQDQIDLLESAFAVPGERQDAIDHALAAVTKLQNDVADAADYTPSYDRMQYAEVIKQLRDKLDDTVARVTPKSRFQFRRSLADAHVDMGAPENDPRLSPGSHARNRHSPHPERYGMAVDGHDAPASLAESPHATKDYNKDLAQPAAESVRRPSFSAATSIAISGHRALHVILPPSAAHATASGSLTDLRDCIVDMSIPTAQGKPFAGLSLKAITNSLVVAGRVSGPVHITAVSDSILVVTARQVRIHECKNVDVYLHCSSHPIIEDCTGMRFAPLPECYANEADSTTENQWQQVDDFKWLKASHSPNWTTLSSTQMLGDEIWTSVVPGQPGAMVAESLRKVGLPRQ